MIEKPILRALVLADHVHTDRVTSKITVIGVFDHLASETFPTQLGFETSAYVRLTGVRGEIPIRLRYVDLDDNKILMETSPIRVKTDNPLGSVEIALTVPPLPMPHAGVYAFEVYADDEMLGDERVVVVDSRKDARDR